MTARLKRIENGLKWFLKEHASFNKPFFPRDIYSDNSIKNTVFMPFRQYQLCTARFGLRIGILNRVIRVISNNFKIQPQENNKVRLFEEMTNVSALELVSKELNHFGNIALFF